MSELFHAAGRGDLDRIRSILDRQPDLVNERGEMPGSYGKRTALHYGVAHAEVVRLLLERGADPNIRDDGDSAMPLHFAAENQNLAVIQLLVEHGADTIGDGTMHGLDVLGWATAWHYVTADPAVVDYLLAHGARYTMPSAVALGAVDAIRDIAERDPADLDAPMDDANHRRRPLHQAVVKKQPAALRLLLELGADVSQRDRAGLTPLDLAALTGERESARLLIDHGAPVDVPAAVGLDRSADVARLMAAEPGCLAPGGRWAHLIVRAAERSSTAVVETLLRLGASPDAADDAATSPDGTVGVTALHFAAFRGNVETVRLLLAHGASPCVRDGKYKASPAGWADYAGQTAARDLILAGPIDIFDAISYGRENRVVEILDADAGAVERTLGETTGVTGPERWCTPLVWAAGHNQPALVRLLLSRGATVRSAPDGETVLHAAEENGFEEVAAILRGLPVAVPPEANIWHEAEHAVIAGDAEALERLLTQHVALFRDLRPPASTPGGLAPDYSSLDPRTIIARNHEFASWDDYQAFRAETRVALSTVTAFEAAADAIVRGEIGALTWLLHDHPELTRARSRRMHRAMLIHYVGPNGIEYFRQVTPPNAPDMARLLVASGADVNATADMYGGGATVLGLAATSITPVVAGVVEPLLAALIDGGATFKGDGGALVNGCLRNGRLQAASYLAHRGADVDLEGAAGIGRLDLVQACFDDAGQLRPPSTTEQMNDGFAWACEFGHVAVVRYLLERGVDAGMVVKHHGQTGLHWAAGGGHVETVEVLLAAGAPVNAKDATWGNTPLDWAHYGRANDKTGVAPERYERLVALLRAAGGTRS